MRFGSLPFLLVIAGALSACTLAQTVKPADDRAAIAALIEDVQDANNAGEVERWVGLFATDFVYMAPGAPPVTSREALVEVAKTGFRNRAAVVIKPIEIQAIGDWAFARNAVTGSVTLQESGRVVAIDVKQLVIYRKNEQGTWRIARLISNSNTQ